MTATDWSTDQVATWTGATVRQVDHWRRIGIIPGIPTSPGYGTGGRVRWTIEAARAAHFIAAAMLGAKRELDTVRHVAARAAVCDPGQVVTWWPQLSSWSVSRSMDAAATELAALYHDNSVVARSGWILLWECPTGVPA